MSRNNFLIKNTALFAISSLSTKVITFLMVPFYTYVLTTNDYGILDIIYTTTNMLFPIISLSIYNAVLRYAMENASNKSQVFSNGLFITLIGIFVCYFLVPLFRYSELLYEYTWYIYFLIVVHCIYSLLSEFARGIEQTKKFVIGNIIVVATVAISNLTLLGIFKMGIRGYITASVIGYVAAIIYLAISVKVHKYFTISVMNLKDNRLLKEMLWYSIYLVPNTLFWWIINSLDRYMILYYYDPTLNGIYAIACRIPVLLTATSQVFVQSWQLSAMKEYGTSSGVEFTNKIFSKMCVILLVISSGIMVILKVFLKIYVAEKYYSAWQPSSILIISAAFSIVASFVGTSYVVAKKNLGNMLSTMTGAVVNFCMNLLLIPRWGLNGAAIATAISYAMVIIYRLIDTRKYIHIHAFNMRIILTLLINLLQIIILFRTEVYLSIWNVVLFMVIIIINKSDVKEIVYTFMEIVKGRFK